MSCRLSPVAALFFLVPACWLASLAAPAAEKEVLFDQKINTVVPPIASDGAIRYDYDIVYVRAGRAGDKVHKRYFTDFSSPITIEPGADLMLLHPDGSEERLVEGGRGSVTDPVISFDGEWCYYVLLHNMEKASQWTPPAEGGDIYKIHLKTKKIVRLTNQRYSPNTGAGDWTASYRGVKDEHKKNSYATGVYNMGPYPLPGGRIVFTSNRDGFRPAKGYPAVALQLFVMDDRDASLGDDEDPRNLEKIGHMNISGALHPVTLRDGRIMFSTLESQGLRSDILWGIWTINPDGTKWNPLVSAFDPGGAPNGFHFQTQLSDGSIVFEEYYNQNNSGFGSLQKMPASPPDGYAAFGPGYMNDKRNEAWRFGRHDNGKPRWYRMPFMPTGSVCLTPFSMGFEGPADRSIPGDKSSPAVGKFTHPSGAPDNHMLACYSPGPVNHQYTYLPQLDGGIYLMKNGEVIDEPAQMRLIKNDPNYNECWPRAVVPYKRIYGQAEPDRIKPLANDGKASPHLPAGTPYGLVGSSSMYKRESYPNGVVPEGKVTAVYAGGNDPFKGLDAFTSHGNGPSLNWHNQGGDVGLYENSEIHSVRILAMEPTTDRQRGAKSGRQFYSHARERLRILGEVPVRKFKDGKEPLDPDGNPDTSFLVKIPADTAFTFQTVDKNGLMLNMAQTWHQLRAGEVRTDCGGCHAHSQKPTLFADTLAGKPDFKPIDLTALTPLVTDVKLDESKTQWDAAKQTGLKTVKQPSVDVEYHRDIKPIFARSCVACHSDKEGPAPAGNLDLDADCETVNVENQGNLPGTYVRLAADDRAKFGHKPVGWDSWGGPQASRYVRKFQARRSLLVWKILGQRTDGFSNDDLPSESEPGKGDLQIGGKPVDVAKNKSRQDVDFVGSQMPPPDAVTGKAKWNGKAVKVEPLTDEDKRTILRWIDLGCPVDLDSEAIGVKETYAGYGWKLDDQRPTLALTGIEPGVNAKVEELLIGMADYGTGLDAASFTVTCTAVIDGQPAGTNLASQFKDRGDGVWVLKLGKPLAKIADATIEVSVKDKQGNLTRIRRSFSVK